MACKGCLECLLKLFNFLLTLAGLGMVGYGIYLFVEYKNHSPSGDEHPIPPSSGELVQLGRPMLVAVSLANNIFDNLPKEWYEWIFLTLPMEAFFFAQRASSSPRKLLLCPWSFFFATSTCNTRGGVVISLAGFLETHFDRELFGRSRDVINASGDVGENGRHGKNRDDREEIGVADRRYLKRRPEEIPTDRTGNFDMIYEFLEDNWKIVKWVALGVVVLEALMFLLALVVRAANRPADYDSDDEYIGGPRQQIRQPLINNRQPAPVTGVPVAGTLDSRPSRNDAWSARMREKYGLDTSEFTYNPSESNRYPPTNGQPAEERGRCTIM
nr:tobamovirus multiplication protein 2A [Ipomoea batatas]